MEKLNLNNKSENVKGLINILKDRIVDKQQQNEIKPFLITERHLKCLLNSHENDIEKCIESIKNYIDFWHQYSDQDGHINQEDIQDELRANIAEWYKTDKKGYPCLIIRTRNFIAKEHKTVNMIKLMLFQIDKAFKEMDRTDKDKVVIIWDREGFEKYKHYSQEFADSLKNIRQCFMDNTADFYEKVYITNINWFYRSLFAIAKTFMKKKIIDKVKLIGDKEDLVDYFEITSLPKDLGGHEDINLQEVNTERDNEVNNQKNKYI